MFWRGWGDPAQATPLPAPVVELLQQLLGVSPVASRPVELAEVALPEAALPGQLRAELIAALGAEQLLDDAETRIRHTRGKSTVDLLRIRAGDAADAPDAVVLPGSHAEVGRVLEICAAHRVAAVPFGGGTSVVGGLAPERATSRAVIAIDLRRMDRLVAVDAESRLATFEPGVRAPRAETLLREHGFTLGHYPQSYEWASIGGFAATRSSGQASAGYGRFDDLVVQIRAATPAGTLELGRAPRSAAGPDLRQLVLGSEGAFGVITSVTVQVRPAPETTAYEAWRFDTLAAGLAGVRKLAQDGPLPTVVRLSDEAETAVGLAQPARLTRPGGPPAGASGCLLVIGYEGTEAVVAARRDEAAGVLETGGAEFLGTEPGESWARGRFAAPYLRDALLDAGALAETLETATFWSRLPRLYDAVRDALTTALTAPGVRPLVLCHVSHVYPAGASLYFTVVCAQDADPVAQWNRAKDATNEAITAAGGTISHHHGVGTDHRDRLTAEVGPLGVAVLRAVKDRLDPAGILNPRVLIP
ncbi:MAG TPA: FAD-binding oxidoreductase [Jiangellaceae bacterium]|nr:FAD-binding oxidoreductase [Jiangellaceae bacterium]